MTFKEKNDMRKKADLVFEKTLDMVFENKNKENLIKDLWELSNLGEQLYYTSYKLEEYDYKDVDDLSNNDKKKIKELSEERIVQKLEYYTQFLKIIEKYNK